MPIKSHVKKALRVLDGAIESVANAAYIANFGISPPGGSVNWKEKAKAGWKFAKRTAGGAAKVLLEDWEEKQKK